jgi:hypothetical protein
VVRDVLAAAGRIARGEFGATPSLLKCSLCPFHLVCTHAHGVHRAVNAAELETLRM